MRGKIVWTVLVTGASARIGMATALLLARNGFKVFGTSRRPSGRGSSSNFEMLQLDVTSDAAVNSLMQNVLKRNGAVPDVLVNNAGIGIQGSLEETSLQEARSLFETNFWGSVRMVNAVLPGMRKRGSGQIINLGSIASYLPMPFHGYLSTSKAAIAAYSTALYHEVKRFGIKVTVIEPGQVNTHEDLSKLNTSSFIADYDDVRTRALVAIEKGRRRAEPPYLLRRPSRR